VPIFPIAAFDTDYVLVPGDELARAVAALVAAGHRVAWPTSFLRAEEIAPERSWQLLAWCAEHGGTEFFIREMSLEGRPETNVERADALLAPFRLSPAVRPRTVVYAGEPDLQETALWALNSESIKVLRELLPGGLFTPPSYDEAGWLEEPTFYRHGSILLGVVSHEGYAVLTVSEHERGELLRLGVSLHSSVAAD